MAAVESSGRASPSKVIFDVEDVLSKSDLRKLNSHIEDLEKNLNRRKVSFDEIRVSVYDTGEGKYLLDINVKKDNTFLVKATRKITVGKKLEHSLLLINEQLQGKGVAKDILKLSLSLTDTFNLPKINLTAGLENGAYTWLRYGFFPNNRQKLSDIFSYAVRDGKLKPKQKEFWDSLSNKEQRAFVLTDDFRAYKLALLGQEWKGSIDLRKAESREILERRITEARAPLKPEKVIGPDLDSVASRPDVDLRPGAPDAGVASRQTIDLSVERGSLATPDADLLNSHVETLRSRLNSRGIAFTDIKASLSASPTPGEKILLLSVQNGDDKIINTIRRIAPGKELESILFQISDRLQGKGIAKDFLNFNLDLSDTFKLPKVTLLAGLRNGAYTWLRYGYFPTDVSELDDIFVIGEDAGTITEKQLDKWESLSKKKKRAFVLTDEFRNYKEALLGKEWSGSIDLTDPKSRAIIEGRINEATADRSVGPDLDSVAARPDLDLRPGIPNAPDAPPVTLSFQKGIITSKVSAELNSNLDSLRDGLRAKGIEFTDIDATLIDDGSNTGRYILNVRVNNDGRNLVVVRRRIITGSQLFHDLFEVSAELQGKGISKDFLRFSLGLSETFSLKKIDLEAALQNGAYTWLRYGYFPNSKTRLSSIFAQGVTDGKLTSKQKEFWDALSNKEQRAFVLTDDFRAYKNALLGKKWKGSIDLTNAKSRAILEGRISEARPPPNPETAIGPDLDSVADRTRPTRTAARRTRTPRAPATPRVATTPDVEILMLQGTPISDVIKNKLETDLRSLEKNLRDKGISVDRTAAVLLEREGRLIFSFEAVGDSGRIIHATRIVDVKKNTMTLDSLTISETAQKQGISKDILKMDLDTVDALCS